MNRISWRAISVVGFLAQRYPGTKAAQDKGRTPCEDAATAAAPDKMNLQWSYEWPTAKDWAADQHYGICWVKGA